MLQRVVARLNYFVFLRARESVYSHCGDFKVVSLTIGGESVCSEGQANIKHLRFIEIHLGFHDDTSNSSQSAVTLVNSWLAAWGSPPLCKGSISINILYSRALSYGLQETAGGGVEGRKRIRVFISGGGKVCFPVAYGRGNGVGGQVGGDGEAA